VVVVSPQGERDVTKTDAGENGRKEYRFVGKGVGTSYSRSYEKAFSQWLGKRGVMTAHEVTATEEGLGKEKGIALDSPRH